jgi:hypothetical protein
MSNLSFAKTKQTDASTIPGRVEVTMHKSFGQQPTVSMSGDSTIFSKNEQMPHVVCDLSNLGLAPESTCPLPPVSSSHSIPLAQSV